MLIRTILIGLFFSQQLLAQEIQPSAQLTAPATADIGSKIDVSWEGPGITYDLIYVVAADADDNAKAIHKVSIMYPDRKTLSLTMPDNPGDYQLRYVSKKNILARSPIIVNDVPTSINAPD